MTLITDNAVYICTGLKQKPIAICTNIDTAKLLVYESFQYDFDELYINYFMQYVVKDGNPDILICMIVNVKTNEKSFNYAEIEKITLNERLF